MTTDEIRAMMDYKAPTPIKLESFAKLREAATQMVLIIDATCPPSADRTAAVRQVQDALMTANRCVANDGLGYR